MFEQCVQAAQESVGNERRIGAMVSRRNLLRRKDVTVIEPCGMCEGSTTERISRDSIVDQTEWREITPGAIPPCGLGCRRYAGDAASYE